MKYYKLLPQTLLHLPPSGSSQRRRWNPSNEEVSETSRRLPMPLLLPALSVGVHLAAKCYLWRMSLGLRLQIHIGAQMMEVLAGIGFVTQEYILSPLQFGIPYSRPQYVLPGVRASIIQFFAPHLPSFCPRMLIPQMGLIKQI